jgi:tetratricopeptide (TPR) repeat protein
MIAQFADPETADPQPLPGRRLMKIRFQVAALIPLALLAGAACSQVQAKAAFKDGNKAYKEERFREAIEKYSRALELQPDMPEALFYLGSSHQALYRPGKETPENQQRLQKAIEAYKRSLEVNKGTTENEKQVRANALAALTGIYSEEPFKNYDEAIKYANQLVQENPNDPKNLLALANLYEKFDRIDDAQGVYEKLFAQNANDVKLCGALAAFYNKPLWEGRSKFDQAIETLQKCALLAPEDPQGYQKVATFYWDKAYRDPLLDDAQKEAYTDKGLEFVDKALSIKPDYVDAIIYKGLLYRVKALVAKNPKLRQQYLDQAQTLQKQGLELKKQQAEAEAAAAAAATPSPGD